MVQNELQKADPTWFENLSNAIVKDDLRTVKRLCPQGLQDRFSYGNHYNLALEIGAARTVDYFASFADRVLTRDLYDCIKFDRVHCLEGILRGKDWYQPSIDITIEHTPNRKVVWREGAIVIFEVLRLAVKFNNLKVLTSFLPLPVHSSECSKPDLSNLLHLAAEFAGEPVICALLAAGAELQVDDKGRSVLHAAAKRNSERVFAFFAARGVPLGTKDHSGANAMDIALFHNNLPVIRLLVMQYREKPAIEEAAVYSKVPSYAFLEADMDLVYRLLDIGFRFSDPSFEEATQTSRESTGTSLLKSLDMPRPGNFDEQVPERFLVAPKLLHTVTESYARKWLYSCLNSHGLCMLSQTEVPYLPRRVLKITQDGACCRLVEMPDRRAYYATVSHRWQGRSMYSTTRCNLQTHRKQINVDRLSPSIRYAIQAATTLGLSYLWVDALCIIQDSETDKLAEISKMANIYSNSCLTIAIADPGVFSDGQTWPQHYTTARRPEGELDTRAWVLQEKILSRRVLSYTKFDVYWECLTHTVSSAHAVAIAASYADRFRESDLRVLKEAIQLGRLYSVNAPVAQYLRQSWHRVVEDYSRRYLTNPEDKSRAIMAVASRISDVVHDEYIAGLWRNNIIADLCWARASHNAHSTETSSSSAFRAPSWSWLNATFAVSFVASSRFDWGCFRGDAVLNTSSTFDPVLQVQLRSAPSPLGEVSALIRLQGILLDFHETMNVAWKVWRQNNEVADAGPYVRGAEQSGRRIQDKRLKDMTQEGMRSEGVRLQSRQSSELPSFEVYPDDDCTLDCAGLLPDDAKAFWTVGMSVWLVLEPIHPGFSNTGASTYRRIGILDNPEFWETRKSTKENSLKIIDLV